MAFMALTSDDICSAKRWADMDDEPESDWSPFGFSTSTAPKMTPTTCSANDTDETCSETCSLRTSILSPLDCKTSDSEGESVQETPFEGQATEFKSYALLPPFPEKKKQPQILATTPANVFATTPIGRPEPQVLDLSRGLFISGSSRLNNEQSGAPVAGVFYPKKLQNRPISFEELARRKVKPMVEDIAMRMTPWSHPATRRVCSTSLDACTDVGQDSCPQPLNIDEASKQAKRANKPSKFRRDRYKALVEQLQQEIDADPTIEFANLLPLLPSFIASDEKLKGKLEARLQHHRRVQQQR